MPSETEMLKSLPLAVYVTDAEGRITFFNEAAEALWGHRPDPDHDRWCGAWRLAWPDGRPMPHEQCPMATALKTGVAPPNPDGVIIRPDGTRLPFRPHPTLIRDAAGTITGAINVLVETSERNQAAIDSARLAAIVASSDDAIVSKSLDGTIMSWNAGAERVFGWTAEEMIGRSIITVIPPELRHEEDDIIARLKRGERIDHFDTVRMRKDGRRINLSITVSPVRDATGAIVGASKVARDITDRKQAEDLQRLLFDELNHRVKNTLATIQAIAGQSLRRAASPAAFVTAFNGRVQALARAHDLLVHRKMRGADMMEVVREQVLIGGADGARITVSGPILMLDARIAVQLGMVLHELATNARKYGALRVAGGTLAIDWIAEGESLVLSWREQGMTDLQAPENSGFGTTLIERTIAAHGGKADIAFRSEGVHVTIRLPLPTPEVSPLEAAAAAFAPVMPDEFPARPGDPANLRGKRILVVEDEPLIAMEVDAQLTEAGCEVIGPVGSLTEALEAGRTGQIDAALLDANLGGLRVDSVAALLKKRGIPFAFATGYGADGLPQGFADVPVLAKPYEAPHMFETLSGLLDRRRLKLD